MEDYKVIGDTGIIYFKNDLLGSGTFAKVFRGFLNGEVVAVKKVLLNRTENEDREVNLQTRLDHTNVLAILKVAEDDDFRYIVLEFCAGTLEEVINKTFVGPILPPDQVVLCEIADGLYYIHSQKLIHRDIKPENILISESGQIKLSDFGLSKEISTRDTCSMSGLKGTSLWMAPELVGNKLPNKVTPKCDVFACGCVFFVFLTRVNGGIHPFGDKNDHLKIQMNIREGIPVNLDALGWDHLFADVIETMIEKDPSIRMSSEEVQQCFFLPHSFSQFQRVQQAQEVQQPPRFRRVQQAQQLQQFQQAQQVQPPQQFQRAQQVQQFQRVQQAQQVQRVQQAQQVQQPPQFRRIQQAHQPQQFQQAQQVQPLQQSQQIQSPQQFQRAQQAQQFRRVQQVQQVQQPPQFRRVQQAQQPQQFRQAQQVQPLQQSQQIQPPQQFQRAQQAQQFRQVQYPHQLQRVEQAQQLQQPRNPRYSNFVLY